MSAIYYEVKVKYRKTDDTGNQKVVTEAFLVDAISFTEAESRTNEIMREYLSEEFKIANIKVANYSEVHPAEEEDFLFRAKVSLLAYDEESGKERKTNMYLLIPGNDAKHAYDNTIEVMKNTMGEYSIPSISETKIMAVFPYVSENE